MINDIWDTYWSNRDNWDWWKKPTPEVLEFVEALSPVERPEVLDLGCGLGRHAIAFAVAGFTVIATDASSMAIRHLEEWAAKLHLTISTQVCDAIADNLPHDAFDVVLSYNVLYHGSRQQFSNNIEHVRKLLKCKGLLYFTCPSRQDGKYGFGVEVAPHTYRSTKSVTPGDIHYFVDKDDLTELLAGFRTLDCHKREGYWDNKGESQFFSNWHILAEKE